MDWLIWVRGGDGSAGLSQQRVACLESLLDGLLSLFLKGHTMTAKVAETQLWQQNLASLIRSGLFSRASIGEQNGLFTVVGVYADETCSAPLAKYSDLRRATDAATLVNRLAVTQGPIESN